eukprot:749332-Hanusia_phi.AAC.7
MELLISHSAFACNNLSYVIILYGLRIKFSSLEPDLPCRVNLASRQQGCEVRHLKGEGRTQIQQSSGKSP